MVLGMGASERRVVEVGERSKRWERGEGLRRGHRVHREKRNPRPRCKTGTWGTRERRGTQDPGNKPNLGHPGEKRNPRPRCKTGTWGTRDPREEKPKTQEKRAQDPGGMTGRGESERDYSRLRMRSAADLAAFLISATLWAAGSESGRRSARTSALALITQRRLLRVWEMASMRLAGKRLSWRGSMTGAIWEPSLR